MVERVVWGASLVHFIACAKGTCTVPPSPPISSFSSCTPSPTSYVPTKHTAPCPPPHPPTHTLCIRPTRRLVDVLFNLRALPLQGLSLLVVPVLWTVPRLLAIQLAVPASVLEGAWAVGRGGSVHGAGGRMADND